MKKILIALDYDPSAEKIAVAGYEIAKAMNAEVVLVHVIADPAYYTDIAYSPIMGFNGFVYPGIDEMLEKELLKDTHDYLDRTKEHLGDERIETMVIEGDFVDSILDKAQELDAGLIVIGTHTRRGIDKLMNGSNAEKILGRTKIPLYIIPNAEEK